MLFLTDQDVYTITVTKLRDWGQTGTTREQIKKFGLTAAFFVDYYEGSFTGVNCTQLNDLIGTNNATQGTAAKQPPYINGEKALHGDIDNVLVLGTDITLGTNDACAFGWVRHPTVAFGYRIIGNDNDNAFIPIVIVNDGKVQLTLNNHSYQSTSEIDDEAWHFVVFNIDRDGNLYIYIDDMTTHDAAVDITADALYDAPAVTLSLMADTDGTQAMRGEIRGIIGFGIGMLLTESQRVELMNMR